MQHSECSWPLPLLPAFCILDDCNRPQSDAALFPAHGFRFPCQTAVVKVRLLGFSGFTLMYCRNNGRLAPRVRTLACLPLYGYLMHCANILSGGTVFALKMKVLTELIVKFVPGGLCCVGCACVNVAVLSVRIWHCRCISGLNVCRCIARLTLGTPIMELWYCG